MALLNLPEESGKEVQKKKVLRTALRLFISERMCKERSFILLSLPYTPIQLPCP